MLVSQAWLQLKKKDVLYDTKFMENMKKLKINMWDNRNELRGTIRLSRGEMSQMDAKMHVKNI